MPAADGPTGGPGPRPAAAGPVGAAAGPAATLETGEASDCEAGPARDSDPETGPESSEPTESSLGREVGVTPATRMAAVVAGQGGVRGGDGRGRGGVLRRRPQGPQLRLRLLRQVRLQMNREAVRAAGRPPPHRCLSQAPARIMILFLTPSTRPLSPSRRDSARDSDSGTDPNSVRVSYASTKAERPRVAD